MSAIEVLCNLCDAVEILAELVKAQGSIIEQCHMVDEETEEKLNRRRKEVEALTGIDMRCREDGEE